MKKYTEILCESKILRGFLSSGNNKSLVIMLHGFTGNKTESRLLFKNLSERLDSIGFDSLRMDYFGHGESDGQFLEMTLSSLNNQVQSIIKYAEKLQYDNMYLLGFSMGGMLALLNLDNKFKKTILISPAVQMPEITRTMFEDTPLDNGNADVGGLELSRDFYESLIDVNVKQHENTYTNQMLFIIGKNDTAVPYQDVLEIEKSFRDSKIFVLEKGDHVYSSINLREKLYSLVEDFLKE